jgi:hypothetical protein
MNCSDEFDVYGFKIFSGKDLIEFLDHIENLKYPYQEGFGTNDILLFESHKDALLSLTVKGPITQEHALLIEVTFGKEYGKFPHFGKGI